MCASAHARRCARACVGGVLLRERLKASGARQCEGWVGGWEEEGGRGREGEGGVRDITPVCTDKSTYMYFHLLQFVTVFLLFL